MLSTWTTRGTRAAKRAAKRGQLLHARSALCRVLAARKLAPSPADAAAIDACADLAPLDRWLEGALVAPTVAAALAPAPRAAAKAPAQRRKAPRSP